jgi:hypothetical protein
MNRALRQCNGPARDFDPDCAQVAIIKTTFNKTPDQAGFPYGIVAKHADFFLERTGRCIH